jgi:hypothetical protein
MNDVVREIKEIKEREDLLDEIVEQMKKQNTLKNNCVDPYPEHSTNRLKHFNKSPEQVECIFIKKDHFSNNHVDIVAGVVVDVANLDSN